MNPEPRFPIVGVGASAGGIQALKALFRSMPVDPDMAFVVLMHLAPDRESSVTEIIARETKLNVEVARDGQLVEKNNIYVLPPKAILKINDGRLGLIETDANHHERSPIDIFFSSLAKDRGEYAVGVVLSGSGGDGALGVKAIKQYGGVTLAQAKDSSGPEFAAMPGNAIATGLVDFAIPVDEMAAKLVENVRSFESLDVTEPKTNDEEDAVVDARKAIYSILREQEGHDFSGYKTRTFMRRVRHRMQVVQCATIADYLERLREDRSEATLLFRDLLINVTSFFRDTEAFASLQENVVPRLFEGKSSSDSVRVWAPGCATGEEVFSIAILLLEHMDKHGVAPHVTIFATDVDEPALVTARAGRYPEALMEGVSLERRRRFFTTDAQSSSYVVAKTVRDLCVFSPHSVLRDPPFSRMDLISCRNMLIYFGAETQRQVIPIFHYALRPGGFLFLGMSESTGQFSELFAPFDKKHCLFQALDTGRPARLPMFASGSHPTTSLAVNITDRTRPLPALPLRQAAEARIVEQFAPPHVVVNAEGDIVHFSARTGKYLEAPAGTPNRQLLTMARKGLRLDLRGALREAIETGRTATRQDLKVETQDDQVELASLIVEPMPNRGNGQQLFLVVFRERAPSISTEPDVLDQSAGDAARIENELYETRDRLQTTIEEYETTLDELTSANEELVSMNEELQSSNEELESSKEELQSLNEELQTVNQELQGKIEQLSRANSDLRNVFASTQIATVFLDRNFVIRSFTPAASQLFHIIPSDAGRPLTDLATTLDYPDFQTDLRNVLETGTPFEGRKHTIGDEIYFARLTPYHSASGAVEGAVASFIDITALTRSEEQVQKLQADRLKSMKETGAGLAHEINQPLSAAAIYIKTAQRLINMPPNRRPVSVEKTLGDAIDQIMWAGQIVGHLRGFTSSEEPNKAYESMHKIITEAYHLALSAAKQEDIQGTFKLTARDDIVLADRVQVKQALINLIRNAFEAMAASKKRELTITTSMTGHDMILIQVADTGSGVSEEVKTRMFKPFATTKADGAGVGLAISRSIIEAHDGTIWAEPNPAGGAIFSFTLPLGRRIPDND